MITNHIRTLSLVVTFLWLGTIPVHAEVYGPTGDFGWRKSVPLHLILNDEVVSDLGLNHDVAGELKDLQRRVQGEFDEALVQARSSGNFLAPHRLLQKNAEVWHTIRNNYAEQINSLLTSKQQMRLHQIHLQLECGSRATNEADVLSDPSVAKELEMIDAQRTEIASIHSAITRAEGALVKRGKNYDGPNYLDLKDKRSETIMKVLTADQQATFQKIKGAPLKIRLANPLPSP